GEVSLRQAASSRVALRRVDRTDHAAADRPQPWARRRLVGLPEREPYLVPDRSGYDLRRRAPDSMGPARMARPRLPGHQPADRPQRVRSRGFRPPGFMVGVLLLRGGGAGQKP